MRKYQIIYIDPPWKMGNKSKNRVLVPKYNVLQDKDIFQLSINNIADKNCALFLWSINSKLPQSIAIIEKWGFRYVGIAFCWVKTSKKTNKPNCRMSGNYTLQGIEICLLGIKGKMKTKDRTVRQVLLSPREYHSKKPNIIREKIIKLFGNLPRIELFARAKFLGWDCLGYEINGKDIRQELKEKIK